MSSSEIEDSEVCLTTGILFIQKDTSLWTYLYLIFGTLFLDGMIA